MNTQKVIGASFPPYWDSAKIVVIKISISREIQVF